MEAVQCQSAVTGLTHDFYRYPARFSPQLARAVINVFSDAGDLVLDPFVGGGTTLVEARAAGRRSLGTDISSLAAFVSRTKTQVLSGRDFDELIWWKTRVVESLYLNRTAAAVAERHQPYLRNLSSSETWRITKLIQLGLDAVESLPSKAQQDFARCVLLRTGQWAIDGRRSLPSAVEFRNSFSVFFDRMLRAATDFARIVRYADSETSARGKRRTIVINGKSEAISKYIHLVSDTPAKLVLTSPPYPGVHILYHRWQVQGGRETPAPFWIANKMDGAGESHYLMWGRHAKTIYKYFDGIEKTFSGLHKLIEPSTMVAQLMAFSNIETYLPRYLEAMDAAGFREIQIAGVNADDGRLWRNVPSRKWYANKKGKLQSSREVLLLFQQK